MGMDAEELIIVIPVVTISAAVTTGFAWSAGAVVASYTQRYMSRPLHHFCPHTLTLLVCMAAYAIPLLAVILAPAWIHWFFMSICGPFFVLAVAACVCDVLCLHLPNCLLLAVGIPLVLAHLLRAGLMYIDITDPCFMTVDVGECRDYQPDVTTPLTASDFAPIYMPLIAAVATTAAIALISLLTRQVGLGDVKLVAVLTLALCPWTTLGVPLAIAAGCCIAGVITLMNLAMRRSRLSDPIPLGPYLLVATAAVWFVVVH